MISRQHRFHGHHSLHRLYRQAQTVRSSHLSLKYLSNSRGVYRAAVIVSRKVHKSAVIRNLIRRRLYAALAAHESTLRPYDLVFTVFSDQLAALPAAELQKLVDSLLQKARAVDDKTA